MSIMHLSERDTLGAVRYLQGYMNMKLIKQALIGSMVLSASLASAGSLDYEGSSTVGKFIADASKAYTASQLVLKTKTESAGGERCAAFNKCDFGGVAREVNQKYLDKGVTATLIGKDAIAAVVNSANPVKALSTEQLRGIFSQKITNWSEIGGNDQAINVYIVKQGSATRKVFAKHALSGIDYGQTAEVITPDAKIVSTISRDPAGIGQISFAFLEGDAGVVPVSVDGQEATVENSNYPITRPLYLTTNGAPAGETKAFIDWVRSAQGQKVLKQRFVGVR
jgi:phosphate transport system substrate-binding protein